MISAVSKITLVAILGLIFCGNSPALAEEKYGLSMVGNPMMPHGFTHFNYANPSAPKGGTFRQAIIGSFDTLNPFSLKGTAAQSLNLVYDRLMMRSWDEPFTLYPLIAESIEVPDDRSSITFHLNPKARFQDGSPITTDDVLYSFQTLKDNGRPNMRNIYKLVSDIDKISDRKIKFSLSDARTNETVMILAMMPILSEKWWSGQDLNKTILTPPNSTGPYIIKEVEIGRRIVLERNPNYWAEDIPAAKGHYNFDRIIFNYFKNQTTAFESFKSGDTDIWIDTNPGHWSNAYDFPAVTFNQVRREEIKHGRVEKMWGFIFNSARPPFDNRDVRKALSLALDYDWINKNIFYGQYNVLTSYFPNSNLAASGKPSAGELALLSPFQSILSPDIFLDAWTPQKTGDQKSLRSNLILADRLLVKSGWSIKDKVRINRDTGKPMDFEILLGTAEEEKIALSFKRSLARLGINVKIRTLDAAAFQSRLSEYDYDMILYNWQNTLSPGTEQSVYWGCASASQKGRFNYAKICHPAIENLVAQIPDSTTPEDMQTRVRALDRVLISEKYTIPLFYMGRDFVASWTRVSRPATSSLYGNIMETWWFSEKNDPPLNHD
jgi:microcin C transport system substrate-binding protein